MRVLVIGSEGNIGRHLVPYLINHGHDVLCSDIKNKFADRFYQADIVHPNDLYPVVVKEKPEVIINLAAMVSRVTCEACPHLAIDRNITGTNNVIQLAKIVSAKLIVFSTSEVYGNTGQVMVEDMIPMPNNRYGLSKYLCEQLVTYEAYHCGLKAIILRPFMFYHEDEEIGIHRSAMIRFAYDLYHGSKIQVHAGSRRSWLHMDDAVVAIEKSMHLNKFCVMNIAHPTVIEMSKLAMMFCAVYGVGYRDCVEEVFLPQKMTLEKIPSVSSQKTLLNFEPTISVEEGVRRVSERIVNADFRHHSGAEQPRSGAQANTSF